MIGLRSPGMMAFIRLYVIAVLLVATLLSPPVLSFIPILLILWYLYQWRWPITTAISLLTECFMFFAIALLLTPHTTSLLCWLAALPVLLLINRSMEEAAESPSLEITRHIRRPTRIFLTIIMIVMSVLVISLLMGSLSLILACATLIAYFGIIGIIVLRRLSYKPVEETQVQQQMVAGTEAQLPIQIRTKSRIEGLAFLESPYEWLQLSPELLSLKQYYHTLKVNLSPPLAGPSIVKIRGKAIDRWGLMQVSFELAPIQLYVIPRARYAAWLAKRYLAGTRAGALPLISSMESFKPVHGLRRGVEYYGSQLYQPGDSLKNIDWKHSLKYDEMITKEFAETHVQSAVILINLAVGNTEEADELAYNIIVTAITLAQENIPAALAVYDHESVKLTTAILQPRQLLIESLRIAQEMVTFINPVKYLNPPDVTRLKTNIGRLHLLDNEAATTLAEILQMEYNNLNSTARHNPASQALTQAFTKNDKQSNIVVISRHNHDAEALAFNKHSYNLKGNAVITV